MRKYIIILLTLFMFCSPVYGADQKISELTDLGAKPASNDYIVIYDSSTGLTKKVAYTYLEDIKNVNLYGGLTAAVASIGATETTVMVTDSQTVTADLTIPTTLELIVTRGGDIAVSAGKVLTINGSILAGSYQIFSGTGTVVFSGQGVEYGAWKSGGTDAIRGKVTDLGRYAADAEATDSYVITLSPAPTAYYTGQVIHFYAKTANTGACTLNVNSLGAKTIKKNHDQDTVTGDIEAGQHVIVEYDGTYFQMQSQTAQISASTINLTGGQIAFPATAVPSADPNTLDDYEKGTYTITVVCATSGTVTVLASADTAGYVKIGDKVHAQGRFTIQTASSPVGDLQFLLPFAAANPGEYSGSGSGSIGTQNVAYTGDYLVALVQQATSYFEIQEVTTNAAADYLEGSDLSADNTEIIWFSVNYIGE